MARTLFDKIWDAHVVERLQDGACILYIDRHLLHEVTSPQAFEGLRAAGRAVRRPDATIAVTDHNVPTSARDVPIAEPESRLQVETLEANVAAFGVPYIPLRDVRQGIVHIVGPEQGLSLPGMTIVCGDSHTSTHGALGALAFGIGTSEVEHVLATQTLQLRPAKNMKVQIDGALAPGVSAKDLVLAVIGQIGTAGGTGHVIEYAGEAIRALDMAGRMTVCNMSIEAGARAGLIAPDDVTFDYVRGRPHAPHGEAFDRAVEYWRTLGSDADAAYDKVVHLDAASIAPMVTWGTSPETVAAIGGTVPDPDDIADPAKRADMQRMLGYMALEPGSRLTDIAIDVVFIGSCTNGRIEDLRAAADVARGRHVAPGVRALVVPGSGLVKQQAEAEGLDRVLTEAGFEWREAGCSMCLGMNPDKLTPGQRCASTSNRNFEGRQGPGGRTHLLSPAMAAAAAVTGRLTDVRTLSLMRAFTTLTGIAAALPMSNIDTDKIMPARFLKTILRGGLGAHLFDTMRFDETGAERPDFVLNREPWRHAEILIAHENFGCGSSREHAPWGLLDFGIRCVIAPDFADIFYGNCFKNGILPLCLPRETCDLLMQDAAMGGNARITVDLERQVVVRPNGEAIPFAIDPLRRHMLLHGLDEIGQTLEHDAEITAFENRRLTQQPWLPAIGPDDIAAPAIAAPDIAPSEVAAG